MSNTKNEDGWSSECPKEPGEYEFRHAGNQEPTAGKFSAIGARIYHRKFTNPQWRPAKAVSETPLTDAEISQLDGTSEKYDELCNFSRSLETRLADAEKRMKDDEERVKEWRDYSDSHGREIATILADRDAWKALAGRLGEAAREISNEHSDPEASNYNECDTDPCEWCVNVREDLAELRRAENK